MTLEHPWDVTPQEAIAIQERLRPRVVTVDDFGPVSLVAGIDIGFENGKSITRAAVVTLGFPDLGLREEVIARRPTTFPYVPGLLSFREAPAALEALARLEVQPDLLLCDGQGLAHPRRFGLACHIGLLTGLPAVGVAKSRLIGVHDPVPETRGSWRHLRDGQEIVGAVLRTRSRVRPVYVSIGHRISLETAIEFVMRCTPRYRLSETTRRASG